MYSRCNILICQNIDQMLTKLKINVCHKAVVSILRRGHRYYLDTLLVRKISKRHFLKDIENSFQEVTQIGPEPRHFFSFSNISTNRVARDFQNFGRNGP